MTTASRRPPTTSNSIFQWRSLKTRVALFTLAIFLIGSWSLPLPSDASDRGPWRILVLQSYHADFTWTADIMKGIHKVFDNDGQNAEFYIEYMDAKRFPKQLDKERLVSLREHLVEKYLTLQPDVIITVDDDALRFLLDCHETIFPRVSIVFCGVNNPVDEVKIAARKVITGVMEVLDRKETIDAALALHPEAKKLAVITDTTTNGIGNRLILRELAKAYEGRIQFVFLDEDEAGITLDVLRSRLSKLDDETIVYYGDFFRDKDGFLDQATVIPILSKESRRPIYSPYSFIFGFGAMGGKLNSALFQGEKAAQMAMQILKGASPSQIPIMKESVNKFMFDFRQMERWNIREDRLPSGSIVMYKRVSFFEENRQLVIGTVILFIILISVIVALIFSIHRRKRAEVATEEAHKRFLTVLNGLDAIVYVADMETFELLFVNKFVKDLFGDIVGQPCWKTIQTGQTGPCAFCTNNKLLDAAGNSTGIYNWEFQNTSNGHWYDIRDRALPWVDGRMVRLEIATDITERKQAEEALRESENEFRNLAEAMPQIVWITRPDGWNIYFNEQWVNYTGLTLEESYGHGWNKPFHPDDQQRAWDAWQNATKNGAIYVLDCRLRRADGVYTWWLIRGVPMKDAHGTILKWFGTCTDINELKQAEESLRINSERLKNLNRIDQDILLSIESPEAVVQTALHHMRDLLQCQRTSVGIFDLEKKEVRVYAADVDGKTIVQVGKTLTEEIYGVIDNLRQSRMEIVEDMSKMASPSAVNRILQAEGIQSSINVALVSALEMYGVLNIGWENPRTITPEETEIAGEVASQITIAIEKASLLNETRRYAAELEQRVEDRTAQLNASNKELEAFSYSVSHDLRAPLRHIDGYVELLITRCRDSLSEKGVHYVNIIADSARQMGVLIDNLLQFSRTGRAEMRMETLDMNKPLQEARTLLDESHSGRTIEWVISELPTVQGDYAMLRQVWKNLLDNAIKYTRMREIAKIEVGTRKENKEIIFFIKDNGVGFDMRHASKLFGVFQRLHSLEEFEGTGIGLANVHRIITRHGGRIWAEAEINQGATFYFTLSKSMEERNA